MPAANTRARCTQKNLHTAKHLAENLTDDVGLSATAIVKVLHALGDVMCEDLAQGYCVRLHKLGTFRPMIRKDGQTRISFTAAKPLSEIEITKSTIATANKRAGGITDYQKFVKSMYKKHPNMDKEKLTALIKKEWAKKKKKDGPKKTIKKKKKKMRGTDDGSDSEPDGEFQGCSDESDSEME